MSIGTEEASDQTEARAEARLRRPVRGREAGRVPFMSKRFVLFSPFAWPEPISTGRYNSFLADALMRAGHQVTVVCSHPLYPDWKPYRERAQQLGVRQIRGGAWLRYPARPLLRRAVLELWFAMHAGLQALFLRRRVDVAVAVFPPSLFAAVVWAVLPARVRRIGIVHDLQGLYSMRMRAGVLTRLIHFIEERAFRACSELIFLSEAMATLAAANYGLQPERVRVHYPFATLAPAEGVSGASLPFAKGRKQVVYAGALGDKQCPDALISFMAKAAAALPEVDFHVFSRGRHWRRLRAQWRGKRIEFHPLVPEHLLAELYARADVQLLPQMPGTGEGSLPSKLPNLLVAGSKILALGDVEGELARLVRDSGGRVVEWNDDRQVAALTELLNAPRRPPPGELLRKFDVAHLVAELADA